MENTEQPASIVEATQGQTSMADIFPDGAPAIQVGFWNPTIIYVSLGIAIAALIVAVMAILKKKK